MIKRRYRYSPSRIFPQSIGTRMTRYKAWRIQKNNIPHASGARQRKQRYGQDQKKSSVATEAKGLVQIGTILGWESTQAFMTAPVTIEAFSNGPFNVIVFNPTNDHFLSRGITELLQYLTVLQPSYTINVMSLLYTPRSYRYPSVAILFTFSPMSTGFSDSWTMKKMQWEDEAKLTRDWQSEITIPNKYKAHWDKFP